MTETSSGEAQELPQLPVPDLASTLDKYLHCLKGVVVSSQYEQTRNLVEEFRKSEGPKLQKLLLEYAKTQENWATNLWLDDMYLLSPLPLPVNSSPFFLLPKQQFRSSTEQFRFAAKLVVFALQFKKKIDSDELPKDYGAGHGKGRPLCMQTYKHFFAAYRRPGIEKDELFISKVNDGSQHIVVASRNQFFTLKVPLDEIPSEDSIAEKLQTISNLSREESSPQIGLLTTENRRTWGSIRRQLLHNEINQESLRLLETCLFVLCLDDCWTSKSGSQRRDSTVRDQSHMAAYLLHGLGSKGCGANRWYDKFLQVIISRDGVCGVVCEHSASEGITVVRFCEELLKYISKQQNDESNETNHIEEGNCVLLNEPRRISWEIGAESTAAIEEATKKLDKLVEDLDLYVLTFFDYGKDFIKAQKMSPDCYIQLALQLTFFKVHRRLVSTYESASLRQFLLGRVDNIRAATPEALAWVQAMCDQVETTENEKVELFHRAVRKQAEILKYTISGYGTDNHLLGLREMARKIDGELPELFRDKSYKDYLDFRLSTSQVPIEANILVGYGPVVPDGYGCCYNPRSNHIVFCISSFFSSEETSSDFFALSLEGSLLQMRELFHRSTTSVQQNGEIRQRD